MLKTYKKGLFIGGIITFLLCMLGLLLFNVFCYTNVLNSDMSSELVLAKLMSQNNNILVKGWYYSTEIRVVYMTQIAAFFFEFITDYHMVRILTNFVQYAMLFGCFWFFMKQIGFKKITIIWAEVILFLPISYEYFTILEIGTFYITTLCMILIFWGSYIILQRKNVTSLGNRWVIILYLISFIQGMTSIRWFVVTIFPLGLICVLDWLRTCEQISLREVKRFICQYRQVCALAFCTLAGYLINIVLLSPNYYFGITNGKNLISFDVTHILERFSAILESCLRMIGYCDGSQIASLSGVASIFLLKNQYHSVNYLQYQHLPQSLKLVYDVFCSCMIINVFVLLISDLELAQRYFLYSFVLLIPLVIYWLSKSKKVLSRQICCIIIVCSFLVSVTNTIYTSTTESETKRYEPAIEFLLENDYELGYSSFWNSNVITELTNGRIKMASLSLQTFQYANWLMPEQYKYKEYALKKKKFFLMTVQEYRVYAGWFEENHCTVVFMDENEVVLSCEDKTVDKFVNTTGFERK